MNIIKPGAYHVSTKNKMYYSSTVLKLSNWCAPYLAPPISRALMVKNPVLWSWKLLLKVLYAGCVCHAVTHHLATWVMVRVGMNLRKGQLVRVSVRLRSIVRFCVSVRSARESPCTLPSTVLRGMTWSLWRWLAENSAN